jgi:hypothetical protein
MPNNLATGNFERRFSKSIHFVSLFRFHFCSKLSNSFFLILLERLNLLHSLEGFMKLPLANSPETSKYLIMTIIPFPTLFSSTPKEAFKFPRSNSRFVLYLSPHSSLPPQFPPVIPNNSPENSYRKNSPATTSTTNTPTKIVRTPKIDIHFGLRLSLQNAIQLPPNE